MTDLTELSMDAASAAIRDRSLSPIDLTDAYLARIASVDDAIGSYILVLADAARTAAREAAAEIAAGRYRGPLHGLPYAVKDNMFTRGVRTCANSRLMMDHVPKFDATVVTRLRDAGAILLGKLNTWEYGTSMGSVFHDLPFAHPRNPWDRARFTGGSSSGAGAAVAARTAMFALGSDTGGSVRLPAACCGLQGLKPTYGLVSRHGVLPNCWAFDTVGPLCWNVRDCATVLAAIAERPASAPARSIAGLTIGFIADLDCGGIHPEPAMLDNLTEAAAVFARAGAVLRPVSLPAPVLRYRVAASIINWAESATIHEADTHTHGTLMGRALRDKMRAGAAVSVSDYVNALRERRVLTELTQTLMRGVDLLLLPGAFHVAPRFADPAAVAALTADTAVTPFSISGHPALSLCTGFDVDGLPTNAQLVGQWFGEATLLSAAALYEDATPWRDRWPVVTNGALPPAPDPAPVSAERIAASVIAMLPRQADKFVEPAHVFARHLN